MKTKLTTLTAFLLLSLGVFAQAPQQINYQAVARDASGNPMINTLLPLVFEIHQGSPTGTVVYSETQTTTTNQFGLFNVAIGAGTVTTGVFSAINWGLSSFYLQVTVNGNSMQATQLLSVPYALHANTASTGTPGANGINCWDLNGNGFNDPSEDVNGDNLWDALDCKGDSGVAGAAGINGIGINWLGTLTTAPTTPNINDAYYNVVAGMSYIWDGTTWQILAKDGTSSTLTAGTGINIVANTISNTGDLDSTNELITSAILNGSTIEITEHGVLHTISLATLGNTNDTSATNEIQTISTAGATTPVVNLSNGGGSIGIVGTGGTTVSEAGNVLTINSSNTTYTAGAGINIGGTTISAVDTSTTNELQTLSLINSDSLIISGGNGVNLGNIFIPGTGISINGDTISTTIIGDNWGNDTVNVVGANITGSGTTTNPLMVIDGDTSSTNEIQTISKTGNTVTLSNGGGSFTDNVNDADSSITNELQTLSLAGNTLSITSGNTVTLPSAPVYTAGQGIAISAGNVIVNTARDTTVTITGTGATNVTGTYPNFIVNSTDNVNDADALPTNELITNFGVNTTADSLVIDEGGNHFNTPLSALSVNDSDWTVSGLDMYNANLGNVGIGITLPQAKLHISSPDTLAFYVEGNNAFGTYTVTESKIAGGAGAGELYVAGGDTLFQSLEPTKHSFYMNYAALAGQPSKIGIAADTIQFSGRNAVPVTTQNNGNFYNKDTIVTRRFKMFGGTPNAGDVLTSIDALGNAQWQPLTVVTSGWDLTGNAGTIPGTNFIGTTDLQPLIFKTNNVLSGKIDINAKTTFFGYASGNSTMTGLSNTAIGAYALSQHISGSNNTAIGAYALNNDTTGADNTATGAYALYKNTTGYANTATGDYALGVNTTGYHNTANGNSALSGNITGNYNTAIGYSALSLNVTGNYNTAIGYSAGVSTGGLTNATAIGYQARVAASNSMVLGGTGANAVNVGIGTTTPDAMLNVEGSWDLGTANTVTGFMAGAIGSNNVVAGNRALALGSQVNVGHLGAIVMGDWDGGGGATLFSSASNQFTSRFRGGYRFFTDATKTPTLGIYFTNGNVGIGTSTPTQKLDVVGNVQIPDTNDYLYSAPKTHYLTISFADFHAGDPSKEYWNAASSNSGALGYGFFDTSTPASYPLAIAGVHLPDGAIITNVTANIYYDDSNTYYPRIYLNRITIGTSTSPSASQLASLTSYVSSFNMQTKSGVTASAAAPIDNSMYYYYLKFQCAAATTPTAVTSPARLYNVTITYTVNKAD